MNQENWTFFETYKLLFENWRFQVKSNWERSSYFAVFETAALAGAGKVLSNHCWLVPGIVFSALGVCLTLIWTASNHRSGQYTEYWWNALDTLEKQCPHKELKLVSNYKEHCDAFTPPIKKFPPLRYSLLMQFVPTLFIIAWLVLVLHGWFSLSRSHQWGCSSCAAISAFLFLVLVFQVYLLYKSSDHGSR